VTTKPPLERTIEQKFVKWVTAQGYSCLKLNVLGRRSWPDRLVVLPRGRVVWIEFKRPGSGKLSPGQELLHETLGQLGHKVHVCYDVTSAQAVVTSML
jgi:hypothetical protein